jgi:hypothetical protein
MAVSKQSRDGTQFHPGSGWLVRKKSITMHGNLNVKLKFVCLTRRLQIRNE